MQRQLLSIHHLFSRNNSLAQLKQQHQHLQELTSKVRRCLPAATAHHLLSCSYSDDFTLTLYARAAAPATSLRLASHQLLKTLLLEQTHQSPSLMPARIRIRIAQQAQTANVTASAALSEDTAALIGELADTVIDPAIKTILLRLSKRQKKTPDG